MQYNKKKHLKLLKSLKKSGYSRKNLLADGLEKLLDYTSDDDENFFELQKYSAMIVCHLHWENREHYFELIEKLLNGPIALLQLREKYQAIENAVEMFEDELILLEPNIKSEGFDVLIDEVILLFNRFYADTSFSEEELKKLIQKIFIEMKDRYP